MQIQIKRVVLLGLQGEGKTTLFNKITKANLETKFCGFSITQKIVKGTTQFGQGFEVIDTPGFGSSQNKLLHAAGILAALSYGNVNQILIIVKLARVDIIIERIKIAFKPVFRFANLVTIIITHWDQCENDQADYELIKETIKKRFQINSVLKFSKNDDPIIICSKLDALLFTDNFQESQQVKLLESEIYKYFDFLQLNDEVQDDLDQHKLEVENEFRNIILVYKRYINEPQILNDPDKEEILHKIILKIKDEANEVVKKFEITHGMELTELVDESGNNIQYLHYIFLKKEIQMIVEDFIKVAYLKMKGLEKQFFSFLKKCPKCGQVWLKVTGCDGETICGDRVNSSNDEFVSFQKQTKIVIEREDDKIIVNKIKETENQHLDRIKQTIINLLLSEKIIIDNLDQPYEQNLLQVLEQYQTQQNTNKLSEYDFYVILVKDIDKLKGNIFQYLLFMKGKLLYFLPQFNQKEQKGIGCGEKIIWREVNPLSSEELKKVLSTELLEYFADEEQLQKDETNWLDKHYKTIIKDSIKSQLSQIQDVTYQSLPIQQ